MPAFEYEALDARGKKTRGMISADSEVAARRELRRRSMAPLKLARTATREAAQPGGQGLQITLRRQHLDNRELMLVTRQLASLIGAGMPVEEALGLVGQQADKLHVRRVLLAVRGAVTEGEKLSDAMAGRARSFPAVYRAMIAAGENSGGLDKVLDRLAGYLEKSAALARRVQGAMIYPAVLAVVGVGVVALLMVFVVPPLAEQFTDMGVTLPALTRAMIAISGFLAAAWPVLLIALAVLITIYLIAMRREGWRKIRDRMLARLPVIGGFRRQAEAARFARTMGILIASGAVLPDALRAARRTAGDLVVRDAIGDALKDVETGRGLSDALKARGCFPALMVYMIAAGERSGALGEMFDRSADQLEQEVDGALQTALNLLEPGVIILMGGMVITIVLSILLPIMDLNSLALR